MSGEYIVSPTDTERHILNQKLRTDSHLRLIRSETMRSLALFSLLFCTWVALSAGVTWNQRLVNNEARGQEVVHTLEEAIQRSGAVVEAYAVEPSSRSVIEE